MKTITDPANFNIIKSYVEKYANFNTTVDMLCVGPGSPHISLVTRFGIDPIHIHRFSSDSNTFDCSYTGADDGVYYIRKTYYEYVLKCIHCPENAMYVSIGNGNTRIPLSSRYDLEYEDLYCLNHNSEHGQHIAGGYKGDVPSFEYFVTMETYYKKIRKPMTLDSIVLGMTTEQLEGIINIGEVFRCGDVVLVRVGTGNVDHPISKAYNIPRELIATYNFDTSTLLWGLMGILTGQYFYIPFDLYLKITEEYAKRCRRKAGSKFME